MNPVAVPDREFRAAWIATVDNIDWPSRPGLPTAEQKRQLLSLLQDCSATGLNAVIFQVRPACDALYPSAIEPWSEYLTGLQGRGPTPAWDPLDTCIEEGHKLGLQVHVWINPFRAKHPSAKGPLSDAHVSRTNPDIVRPYGDHLWMDPSMEASHRHVLRVVEDLVKRYDLDGIHIDDYFYPYPIPGRTFDDASSREAYVRGGGRKALGEWRRERINQFVEQLYKGVKRWKPWVQVGISPFGIYRPGVPAGIQAGLDQHEQLFADPIRWLKSGWCDYLAPQLYWKIDQKAQSFPILLHWWRSQNSAGRYIFPGLFASRTLKGVGDWPPSEITRQIELSRDTPGPTGQILFSVRAIPRGSPLHKALKQGPYHQPILAPMQRGSKSKGPKAPKVKFGRDSSSAMLEFEAPPGEDVRFIAIYEGPQLRRVVGRNALEAQRMRLHEARDVSVSFVDRYGVESRRTPVPWRD